MKLVGIGHLGTTLDHSLKGNPWKRWRPTIAACWQDAYKFDRYELLYPRKFRNLKDKIIQDIAEVSPGTKVVAHQTEYKDPWDFEEVFFKLHDFISTYEFDLQNEDYLLNITTGTHVAQICMFLLAESHYFPGKILQLGATQSDNPETKAKGTARIIDLDLQKYDPIAARFIKEKQESQKFLKAGIETKSETFNQLIEKIELISMRSKEPILLTGKTGVGKTALARRIFELKKSKHQIKGSYVEVNCATLKGDSVMSTLFGHKKGAFTGALKDRAGLLKEANNGLVFLDEIGELGPDEQAMLLRAIEDKVFLPMGSDTPVESNFQLIAGTNRDLKYEVQQGRFREDLLARINLWNFKLPSLKNRKEDLEPNIDYELLKYSSKTGKRVRFNKDALENYIKFALHPSSLWSGNFRDLNASIMRMGTLSENGKIDQNNVDEEINTLKLSWETGETESLPLCSKHLGLEKKNWDPFDLAQLENVLEVCASCSSLSEASRRLFAVSRLHKKSKNDSDRLKKYLQKFNLDADQVLSH